MESFISWLHQVMVEQDPKAGSKQDAQLLAQFLLAEPVKDEGLSAAGCGKARFVTP